MIKHSIQFAGRFFDVFSDAIAGPLARAPLFDGAIFASPTDREREERIERDLGYFW